MEKNKKTLIKNTIIISIGKLSTQFISYILLPLYTAILSTSEYGTYDLLMTYVTLFTTIVTLQLEQSAFRFLIDSRDSEKAKCDIITNTLFGMIFMSIVFVINAIFISHVLNIDYFPYLILNIIIVGYSQLMLQITRGLGKNILYSVGCAISGILTVILNVILIVFLDFKIEGLLISNIVANLTCFIGLFLMNSVYKYIHIERISLLKLKKYLRYALPLIPNLLSWWIINVSDRTIIAIFLGESANGIYAIANKFSTILTSLYGLFNISWTESVSVNINKKGNRGYFVSTVNDVFILATIICCLSMIVIPLIFPYIINNRYSEALKYIPILIVGAFFNIIIGVYSAFYIALKDTVKVMNTSIIAGILNMVLNLILIKFIGLYAATLSTALSYFIMCTIRYYDISNKLNIHIYKKNIIISFILFIISLTCYLMSNYIFGIAFITIIAIYILYIKRNKKGEKHEKKTKYE